MTRSTCVLLQRPVVVVAQQHSLAAERIVRRQRVAQLLVGDGALEERRRDLGAGGDHRVVGKCRGVVVLEFPDLPARAACRQRVAPESRQFRCAVWPIILGNHPRRCALKHRHALGDLRQLGNHLHPAGAGPDHRHLLARQVDAVIPLRGVHQGAAEVGQAVDVGELWRSEQSGGADDDVGGQCGGVPGLVQLAIPLPGVRVPADGAHSGVKHEVAAQIEVVGHRLEVGQNLGLPSVGAAPGFVGRKRKRVQVTLDIARGTGIAVAPPGAPDAVVALDDDQIVDAGPAQCHRRTQAAEARHR